MTSHPFSVEFHFLDTYTQNELRQIYKPLWDEVSILTWIDSKTLQESEREKAERSEIKLRWWSLFGTKLICRENEGCPYRKLDIPSSLLQQPATCTFSLLFLVKNLFFILYIFRFFTWNKNQFLRIFHDFFIFSFSILTFPLWFSPLNWLNYLFYWPIKLSFLYCRDVSVGKLLQLRERTEGMKSLIGFTKNTECFSFMTARLVLFSSFRESQPKKKIKKEQGRNSCCYYSQIIYFVKLRRSGKVHAREIKIARNFISVIKRSLRLSKFEWEKKPLIMTSSCSESLKQVIRLFDMFLLSLMLTQLIVIIEVT